MFKLIDRDCIAGNIYSDFDLFNVIHEYLSVILEKLNFLSATSKAKINIEALSKPFEKLFVTETMEPKGKRHQIIVRIIRVNFNKREFNTFIENFVSKDPIILSLMESIFNKVDAICNMKKTKPNVVVVKKSEPGEIQNSNQDKEFLRPNLPAEEIIDPMGTGGVVGTGGSNEIESNIPSVNLSLETTNKKAEKLNVFESDKRSYYLIKNDIINKTLDKVPEMFEDKFEIFKMMDEEGALGQEDEFDIYCEIESEFNG